MKEENFNELRSIQICGHLRYLWTDKGLRRVLVKPLILGVEHRHGDIQYTQISYRPVATARFDKDRIPRPYSVSLAIQFHLAFTF
jgi:hypothetical protein